MRRSTWDMAFFMFLKIMVPALVLWVHLSLDKSNHYIRLNWTLNTFTFNSVLFIPKQIKFQTSRTKPDNLDTVLLSPLCVTTNYPLQSFCPCCREPWAGAQSHTVLTLAHIVVLTMVKVQHKMTGKRQQVSYSVKSLSHLLDAEWSVSGKASEKAHSVPLSAQGEGGDTHRSRQTQPLLTHRC